MPERKREREREGSLLFARGDLHPGHPLGPAAAAPRHKWGLTFSLAPTAWLLTATEGTSRNPGTPPRDPSDIDIRKGWSLLERSPGDLDRFGRFELQQRWRSRPNNSSTPKGRFTRCRTQDSLKPAPTAPADSGNESERSWPSSEGSASSTASSGAPFEDDRDYDRTELMQRPNPGSHHGKRSEPRETAAPAEAATHTPKQRQTGEQQRPPPPRHHNIRQLRDALLGRHSTGRPRSKK